MKKIDNFLTFTRGEKMAICLLLLIVLGLWFTSFIIHEKSNTIKTRRLHDLDSILVQNQFILDSMTLSRQLEKEKIEREKKKSFTQNKSYSYKSKNHTESTFKNYDKSSVAPVATFKKSDKTAVPIDFNTADTTALKSLPGIGSTFASRIVRYRERLGGFYSRNQLLEVKGIDSAHLEPFMKYVIISPENVKKIKINTFSFKELVKHPYLEYNDVKKIVTFREKNGFITTWEKFVEILGREDERLKNYIDYQ